MVVSVEVTTRKDEYYIRFDKKVRETKVIYKFAERLTSPINIDSYRGDVVKVNPSSHKDMPEVSINHR